MIYIISISLVLLFAAPVFAQSPFTTPAPARSAADYGAAWNAQRAKTQEQWDQYRINPSGAGHAALAGIASTRSLPGTKGNTADVLRLMESSDAATDDRQMLARIAGDLHDDLGRNGDKATQRDVQESLSRLARNEKDPKVRKTAVLTYSRMGWFQDSLPLLAAARPLLGDRPYHQELAHMLLVAPPDAQLKIVKALEDGEGHNNDLGKEIIANLLRDENAMKQLSPAAVGPLLALMRKQEPVFGSPPQAMGSTTIGAYTDWFNSVVALTAKATGEPPRLVVARLLNLNDDPRKLVALFDDEHSAMLVRQAMAARDLDKVDASLAAFAARYSSNPNVQGFVRGARRNLADAARR